MFGSVFKPYGLVWNIMDTVTDVLGLSLLWVVCSLPIVTIGAATTALYDAVVHGIRYKEGSAYRRFLRTFRAEWKPGLLSTVLWGAILLLCGYVLSVLLYLGQADSRIALTAGVYFCFLLLPIGTACWSSAILSRFAFSFGQLSAMAFRFTLSYLPSTAAIALSTLGMIWFTVNYWLPVFFAPAVTMLIWSLFTERIFRKYGGGLDRPAENEDASPAGE